MTDSEINKIILSYPSTYSIEDPLLSYIYENGSKNHKVKSIDTYDPLADYFKLSNKQRTRTYHDIYGNNQTRIYWRSLVYQAKDRLHMRYINIGAKGIWQLSKSGVERAEKFIESEERVFDNSNTEYLISEGKENKIYSIKYERSAVARKICIQLNGYNCSVCNINFEETYGKIGRNFIHVHHLTPVSDGINDKIDPAKDLVPVCPNCHSMLHKKNPPYGIKELKNILDNL